MACQQFILDRITRLQQQLEEIDNAIIALLQGKAKEYSYNTGQTVRKVTKFDIDELHTVADGILNQIVVLQIRCGQVTSTRQVIPDF